MASNAFKRLNGVFCIYKPPHYEMRLVRKTIIGNLLEDLNKIFVPKQKDLITIEGSTASQLDVIMSPKLAVHPLAIGKGFVKYDIKMRWSNHLDDISSGVCLIGLNKAIDFSSVIGCHSRLIKAYRISGVLGIATMCNFHTGKVVEKSRYKHVTYRRLESVLMVTQAIHQKRAMQLLGMRLDTQEAYEAISEEGIVRPGSDSDQLLYSLSCIEFDPPNFTIEVSCINESDHELKRLIHDIGLLAKTNATTTKIQCIRYGPFTVDDALLHKHWRLDNICDHIDYLKPRFDKIIPDSPSLKQLAS